MMASFPAAEASAASLPAPSWVRSRVAALQDAWVGFLERRRPHPSRRAWDEALDYYEGRYQTRGPDPAAFRRLLARNGVPAWPNPFQESEARHFLYHPDGLLLADIEAVLESLMASWAAVPGAPALPPPEAEDAFDVAWPTMEEALSFREEDLRRERREWCKDAAVCWGMVILAASSLESVKKVVHEDNLSWATIHAWQTAPWARWGIDSRKVLSRAVGLGILRSATMESLLRDARAEGGRA